MSQIYKIDDFITPDVVVQMSKLMSIMLILSENYTWHC